LQEDPAIYSKTALKLEIGHNAKKELILMNYSKDRQERNVLEKEYFDETLRRLKEVTGDKFNAGHGINHEKKDGEHNAKYIAAPSQEQIWQYNMIVDMSQVEIDDTHLMLKTKEMDIDGYKKESEKFLE